MNYGFAAFRECSIQTLFVVILLVSYTQLATASKIQDSQKETFENAPFDIKLSAIVGHDRYGSFYDKKGNDLTEATYLRRVKLGVDYRLNDYWGLDFGFSFSRYKDNEWDLGDAIISYHGFKNFDIKAGHMHEPFGFERLTGLSAISTIERSLATSVFAPGRSYGLQVGNEKYRYTWAFGLFQEEDNRSSPQAATGRFTFSPFHDHTKTIHFGISGSYRDHQNNDFQIKDRGEVFTADNVIRSARFNADISYLLGLEFAWNHNSLTFSSEAMAQKLKQQGGREWNYAGYYAQMSYFIRGEKRQYKKGSFKRIKPINKSGAVEFVMRHSSAYLRDHDIGSDSQINLIGVNYYYDKALQLKFNILFPRISGNSLQTDPGGIASSFRLQYSL